MRYTAAIFISCLLLICAPLHAGAQRFSKPHRLFTIRDGLTKQQVRAFLEDSRGYVWIGTNAGLSRFDGQTLAPYALQQGFLGNKVYGMLEAPDSTIWYRSADTVYRFDGRREEPLLMSLAFWQAQPAYLWELVPALAKQLIRYRCPEIQELKDSFTLLTGAKKFAMAIDWGSRRCYLLQEGPCRSASLPRQFPQHSRDVDVYGRYLVVENDYYTWTGEGLECVARYLPGKDFVQLLHPLAPDVYHLQGQKKYWYRDGQRYRRIEPGNFNRIDKIVMDSQRRLHIATDEGYALLYPDGPEHVYVPQARYPWSVLPDGMGNLWIGSYRDGLVRLKPGATNATLFPLRGPENEEQIFPGKLLGPDGALLFGGYKGIFYWRNGKLHHFFLNEPVEALCWDQTRQCYWVAGVRLYQLDASLQRIRQTIVLPPSIAQIDFNLSAIEMAPDGTLWLAGYKGAARVSAAGEVLFETAAPGPGNCLLWDSQGNLWLGSRKGLFRFDAAARQFYRVSENLFKSPVNNLVQLPQNRMAVVTDTEVYLLDVQNPEKPLITGYWSDKNGYQLLEAVNNGACYDGTYLWIPAGNGIQRINLDSYFSGNRNGPLLRIDCIEETRISLQESLPTVEVGGSSIQVFLSMVNLNAGQDSIHYSLNGGPWKGLEYSGQVMVTGLQHGENLLRFQASIPMVDERDWPVAVARVQAVLPFWERASVQRGMLGLAGVFVMLLLFAGLEWKKKKALMHLLRQAQLSTVQAQLNPHILFNLLTSLQNSIANRSKPEASEHLLRIARLIREVLELSMSPDKASPYKFPTIPLKDEIAFLENYLHLESMQHQPPFHYSIDNGVTSPLVLPPLLVQPLVENAVAHGLRPMVGKAGHVWIQFKEEGDQLVITVSDDGAGPDAGNRASRPLFRYRSRGKELLQERLRLIRQLGFPAGYSLTSRPEGGAVATIHIKKMT